MQTLPMRVRSRSIAPAGIVYLAAVTASLHIGKLPPAVPVLREALGITLVQAGFLLSLVQLGGMALGVAVGVAADGLGLKRSMVGGLLILSVAGALGGWAGDAATLLALRAVEGLGFLLATLPGPSLLRRLVPAQRLNLMLGVWGTYMATGVSLALLVGPVYIAAAGWQAWWWLLAALSMAAALWLWHAVPSVERSRADAASPVVGAQDRASVPSGWLQRLRQTLSTPGPWLVALVFALYAGQWLAVIGFLPAIYIQAGLSGGATGVMTALAAGANVLGSLASGRLLHRGVPGHRLLQISLAVMALCTVAAYSEWGGGLPWAPRYAAVLLFSAVGGLVPGTLFSLAVRLAPNERTVATTVGWMLQWSSFGQFAAPPLVAWVASSVGGWQWTWVVTGGFSLLGAILAARIGRLTSGRADRPEVVAR